MARTDSTLDAQGTTGNPYFDCVGMNSGAVPFKSFVQANGNNAKTLANHFVSYLKGGLSTKVPILRTVHALKAPMLILLAHSQRLSALQFMADTSMD